MPGGRGCGATRHRLIARIEAGPARQERKFRADDVPVCQGGSGVVELKRDQAGRDWVAETGSRRGARPKCLPLLEVLTWAGSGDLAAVGNRHQMLSTTGARAPRRDPPWALPHAHILRRGLRSHSYTFFLSSAYILDR